MKLKGQAQLDLNNISISDLDYELNLTHSDLGVATKKKDGNNENGICLESNLGPIMIKFDLLTNKNNIPNNLKDLNMYLTANYKLEDNMSIGLKYETLQIYLIWLVAPFSRSHQIPWDLLRPRSHHFPLFI